MVKKQVIRRGLLALALLASATETLVIAPQVAVALKKPKNPFKKSKKPKLSKEDKREVKRLKQKNKQAEKKLAGKKAIAEQEARADQLKKDKTAFYDKEKARHEKSGETHAAYNASKQEAGDAKAYKQFTATSGSTAHYKNAQ